MGSRGGNDGRTDTVIGVSRGASSNPFDFYSTTTAVTIGQGKHSPLSPPAAPQHRPTGYSANFRPVCFYAADRDDNEVLKAACSPTKHYKTSHAEQFAVPAVSPKPTQVTNVAQATSGFVKEIPRTLPTNREVYEKFGNTQATVGVTSPTKTSRQTFRDSLSLENDGTGPGYMSTETSSKFVHKPVHPNEIEKTSRPIGPIQDSGFSSNTEGDPVTHRQTSARNDASATSYPQTLVQESFTTPSIPKGNERLPPLNFNGNQSSSYVREFERKFPDRVPQDKLFGSKDVVPSMTTERIKRNDPADYLNAEHPKPFLSTTRTQYTAQAFQDHDSRLGLKQNVAVHYAVGEPQVSGFTKNEDKFVPKLPTSADRDRFTSTYAERFPVWLNKEAPAARDAAANSSFAKGTRHHTWDGSPDPKALLFTARPEVAMSILRKDPTILDDPHQHKRRFNQTSN